MYEQSDFNIGGQEVSKYLTRLKKLTDNKKLSPSNKKLKLGKETYGYNCWGFTSFAMKWETSLSWQAEEDMDKCLEDNTFSVTKAKDGDIIELRRKKELMHTAILVDAKNGIILHKPGCYALEFNTIEGMFKIYSKKYKMKYLRPDILIKNNKKRNNYET